MTSPFAQVADFFYEKGFSILPVQKGEKYPCELKSFPWGGTQVSPMAGWQRFNKVRATQEEIAIWKTWPEIGIGVCLGELSGIVALDLDNDLDNLHEQIASLLPDSPVKKRGAKGYTAFYKYNGDIPSKLSWSKEGLRIAEILSNGQQCLIPNSAHPSGVNYQWLGPRLGEAELPTLTLAHVMEIQKLFPQATYKPTHTNFTPNADIPVEDMLRYLDADSYDSWVQVGMSLKTEYGDAGRSLYHQFSGQSAKYNPKDTDIKWTSFKRTDRTIGSLIYEAKQNGFAFPPRQETEAVEILEGGNLRPIIHKEIEKHNEDIPEQILDAPNLIGDVMKYILNTSMFPQPVLALGAAITLVGTLMIHRVKTDTNLRTNMFIVNMARSGSGKDHARKCIKKILRTMGKEELLIGKPKSDTAVYKAMKRKKCRAILLLDEMGRFLQNITSNKAGSYQQGITTALMDIFNEAGDIYTGDEYASNADQGGRADLEQPGLCVIGTSVKDHVFGALSSKDAIDGFLARWLLFETDRYDIDVLDREMAEPPVDLLEKLMAWETHPTNANPQGNIQEMEIIPKMVPFTDDAKDMIQRYRRECRVEANKVYRKNGIGDALWNRAAEHAAKLSLVAHRMGEPIGALEMKWAIDLVNNRMAYTLACLEDNVSDNQQEASTKKMLGIIKAAGKKGLTKSEITNKTQYLKRAERNELLETLLDMGKIQEETKEGLKSRAVKVYRV